MSIEKINYEITLCKDITGVVFDKEEIVISKQEIINLSYDQYRSMCANSYIYIPVNIAQGHNISVKIHLDDIGTLYRYMTTKNLIDVKAYNPENEFPD